MSLHLFFLVGRGPPRTKFESRSESDEQKWIPEQPLKPVGHVVFHLVGFAYDAWEKNPNIFSEMVV